MANRNKEKRTTRTLEAEIPEVSKKTGVKLTDNYHEHEGLTIKENLFVRYLFLCFGNQTKAAKYAGYSEKSAHVEANRLLKKPNVQAAIAAENRRIQESHVNTHSEITSMLRDIVNLDLSDFYNVDATGYRTLKPDAFENGRGKLVQGFRHTKHGIELQFISKATAMEMLAKHTGYFEKDNLQRSNEGGQVIITLPDNNRARSLDENTENEEAG